MKKYKVQIKRTAQNNVPESHLTSILSKSKKPPTHSLSLPRFSSYADRFICALV